VLLWENKTEHGKTNFLSSQCAATVGFFLQEKLFCEKNINIFSRNKGSRKLNCIP